MKLYLLRVGADSTNLGGGFYSHICQDSRSYTFIPIKDDEQNLIIERAITYQDCTWNNRPIPVDYLPRQIREEPAQYYVHNDPEFETFTYGAPESNRNNYRILVEIMQTGDMLTFYAAFSNNVHDIDGYYFFAYFIVDRVVMLIFPDRFIEEDRNLVLRNHHFIHIEALQNQEQVIVIGNREQSRVFQKAVLLSSRNDREGVNYRPCQRIRSLLGGYNKSMNRSSIRNIPLSEERIDRFKNYLDESGGRLQDP